MKKNDICWLDVHVACSLYKYHILVYNYKIFQFYWGFSTEGHLHGTQWSSKLRNIACCFQTILVSDVCNFEKNTIVLGWNKRYPSYNISGARVSFTFLPVSTRWPVLRRRWGTMLFGGSRHSVHDSWSWRLVLFRNLS